MVHIQKIPSEKLFDICIHVACVSEKLFAMRMHVACTSEQFFECNYSGELNNTQIAQTDNTMIETQR